LSFRDVEELLAQRGIEVSYESIRCWTIKFGPLFARNLRRRQPAPSPRWHLDEVVCTVGGKRMYLWRAVDDEGEVLDLVMQGCRDTDAALKLLKRLLRNQPVEPKTIITDGLGSYVSALRELGLGDRHRPGRLQENNAGGNPPSPAVGTSENRKHANVGLSAWWERLEATYFRRSESSFTLEDQT
jgi:transposase-like protein